MPKIYSWDEIAKDQIATPERLARAESAGTALLRKLHERGWIVAGGIFGSIARRDLSLGSDLDAIVISKPEFEWHVQRILERSFRASMERLFVEPQVIHINARDARTGNHSISQNLFKHIRENMKSSSIVGEPFTKVLRMSRQNALQFERTQLERLATFTSKGMMGRSFAKTRQNSTYYETLGLAVRRTINSARVVLYSMGKLPKMNGRIDDSKNTVLRIYAKAFADKPALVQALRKVVAARDAYLDALGNANAALRSGNKARIETAKKGYDSALRAIEQTLRGNVLFFKGNAKLIREMETKRAIALRGRAEPRRKSQRNPRAFRRRMA